MQNKSDNSIATSLYNSAQKNIGNKQTVKVPTRNDGTVGIRATLNNMGISNDQIGFDGTMGNITLGNKTFMKPAYLDELAGVSYATPSQIQSSLVNYYSSGSNPIMKVSDTYTNYAGKYGLNADGLKYTNGNVTIGGKPLNVLYTDDSGKSWAFKNDIENSMQEYIDSLGISSPNQILSTYNNKYLKQINTMVDSLRYREEFSYNPDADPVYLAYKNKYNSEGNRAGQNIMGNYSSLTGGYANSSAATAAAQTQQYYNTQLTNQIPTLAEQAYKRYAEKYNSDLNLIENMVNVYDKAISNAISANSKTVDNINNTATSNTERDNSAFKKYWERLLSEQKYNWTEHLNSQSSALNDINIEGNQMNNIRNQIYLSYYNKILEAEVEKNQLDNKLTQEKINQLLLQNMFGY